MDELLVNKAILDECLEQFRPTPLCLLDVLVLLALKPQPSSTGLFVDCYVFEKG